jgi:hypothetical protein
MSSQNLDDLIDEDFANILEAQGTIVQINGKIYTAQIGYFTVEPPDNFSKLDHKGKMHNAIIYPLLEAEYKNIIQNVTNILISNKIFIIVTYKVIGINMLDIVFL